MAKIFTILSTKEGKTIEVITMSAEIVIAIASSVLAVALLYHRKAVLLQRESLQATLFNEVTERINSILDKTPPKSVSETEMSNWYIGLFNALTANRNINSKMEKYYRSFIVGYCDGLVSEFPKIAEKFKKGPETQFSLLRNYYKSHTQREAPF